MSENPLLNEDTSNEDISKEDKEKWDFEDYAFTITGIIVGIFMFSPTILLILMLNLQDIDSLNSIIISIAHRYIEWFESGDSMLFVLLHTSPMLFLVTTTIVYFRVAFNVRKCGEDSDSWFTYDFESTLELAISLAISTIIVYGTLFIGEIKASWLGAPISWILFLFILPFVRRKDSKDKVNMPWLCLVIFVAGVIIEIIIGGWIALPMSWLVICAIKLIDSIRKAETSLDTVYDISFNILSVAAMAAGVFLNFWYISWSPILLGLFICLILSKFKRFKKDKK